MNNPIIKTPLFALLLLAALVAFDACKKDGECGDLNCKNGGTCTTDTTFVADTTWVNGQAEVTITDTIMKSVCDCPFGYFGSECKEYDPCRALDCQNGTCVETSNNNYACECETGFEGSDCSTLVREKYLGAFAALENCQNIATEYTLTASPDESGLFGFYMHNFAGLLVDVYAEANDTAFVIPAQTDALGRSYEGIGVGTYSSSSGKISFEYLLNINGTPDTCSVTLTPW